MADGSPVHPVSVRCDLDAEAAVLSAALLSEDAALEALELLTAEDFYADANRRIFETVRGLTSASRRVDAVSVAAELRATGRLDQIGGTPYIAQLADATPAVAHLADHAAIVSGHARVRRTGDALLQMLAEAKGGAIGDADAWLESVEARVCAATATGVSRLPTAAGYRELAADALAYIETAAASGRRLIGRTTGFRAVDEHLGGFGPGDLVILAGRPGMGKTALAVQMAESIAGDATEPAAAIILELELERRKLMLRSLSGRSGAAVRALMAGQADWRAVNQAAEAIAALPVLVDDDPDVTPFRIRAKVRRHLATLRAKHPGIPLGCVVVDYAQLVAPDVSRRSESRAAELAQVSRALKLMAKEHACTVLLLSQLRRPEKGGRQVPRPTMSDLRDSGALEADADVVLAIHREDAYREPGEAKDHRAELLVLKGRNSGEGCHVLHFDGACTRFTERGPEECAESAFDELDRYDVRFP